MLARLFHYFVVIQSSIILQENLYTLLLIMITAHNTSLRIGKRTPVFNSLLYYYTITKNRKSVRKMAESLKIKNPQIKVCLRYYIIIPSLKTVCYLIRVISKQME